MSWRPQGFARLVLTGLGDHASGLWVEPPSEARRELSRNQANSARVASGSGPPAPARQAYSHSASVGRRNPPPATRSLSRRINAWQSFQDTDSTGIRPASGNARP